MNESTGALRRLPAVNTLLVRPEVQALVAAHGKELILFSVRTTLDYFRESIRKGDKVPEISDIIRRISEITNQKGTRSLKKVINATGVVIHTNLGRAPLSEEVWKESLPLLSGYNNLEFNLKEGKRGHRNDHASDLLKFLTGAEDVLVVNNNAAAVMLCLHAFARRKEVIVSRGELVEIGGSFRIPEVMAASSCKMVEVGTTNKTRIEDYRNAITAKTAMLFKAHKSNYVIKGFTEEAALDNLVSLGKEMEIPVIYDLGSGLIRSQSHELFNEEPDVFSILQSGVDLLCFSGDKLFGGPQAGIICGNKELIARLKKNPMLRALRVGKMTLALLEATCLTWMGSGRVSEENQVHRIINRSPEDTLSSARLLQTELEKAGIKAEVEQSTAQCGGGTLPDAVIPSYAVKLICNQPNKIRSAFAEKMMKGLLEGSTPVLGILRQGDIYFDMLCVANNEIATVAESIIHVSSRIGEDRK